MENVCRLVTEVANLDELNTIIVVTHNIEAAMQVADTVIILGRDRNEAGEPTPGARGEGGGVRSPVERVNVGSHLPVGSRHS